MKKTLLLASALSFCVLTSHIFAAVPYQVTDLRTKPAYIIGSNPSFVGIVNGAAIFTTSEVYPFKTLWRTDGTEAGTYSLRQSTENFYSFRTLTDGVYVSWYDTTGSTLWKSDGAHLDAIVSSPTQRISALGSAGQKLFLLANPSREIWVRDGSTVTTVATLPTASSAWTSFGELGGIAYIGTESGLWRSDGTVSGTYSISPVAAYGFNILNGRIVFAGQSPDTGTEFWTSDGTSAGTHIITDGEPGSASLLEGAPLTRFGTRVLFLSAAGTLGCTDGTAAGTQVLRRGNPVDRPQFAVLGSIAFFPFDDGTHGKELWVTDGTAAGTRMVRDASADPNPYLESMSSGATRIYYFVRQASQKPDLFESDGTEAGTHPVFQRGGAWNGLLPTRGLATMGDQVFFTADDGATGDEPWTSDGTDSGTHLIANIARETVGSSNPKNLTGGGDQIYFTGWSDDDVWKLWRSDATAGGTTEVFRLQSEWYSSPLFAKGSKLFLPYSYQATRVIDHVAGTDTTIPCDINFQTLRTDGDVIYSHYQDRWCVTDGTAEGTSSEWTNFGLLSSMAILAGRPYFLSGGYLRTFDGSAVSAHPIASTPDVTDPVSPLFAVRGSLLFFGTSTDSTTGAATTKLWRFSGSIADAQSLVSFEGAASNIATRQLGDGTLLFVCANQFWRTDGTAARTSLLHDFSGGSVKQIVPVGARAIFIAGDAEPDSQLWVTDGTAQGTSMLRDFGPGSAAELVTTGRTAYFVGSDADHGREIWTSDGTVEGTQLVFEIAAGNASAEPHSLAVAGDSLFFAATTTECGTELWALSVGTKREVSIRDARTREDQLSMVFEVHLSAASDTPVTVSYATEDGTAHAGVDYTATSSTVEFAPGEMTRTISVPIANNSTYSGMRYFLVRIASADGILSRGVGAGVIEEDDISSDLELRVVAETPHAPYLQVRNNGPAPASNVRICYVTDPYEFDPICRDLPALPVGGTLEAELYIARYEATFAGVSAAEPDPDPTNNMTSYFKKQYLIASPAHAAVGATGLLVAMAPEGTFDRRGTLTSSDASIVTPLPAEFTLPGSVTETVGSFSALKPGVATVSLWVQPSYYYLAEIPIRVYPSIEDARRLTPYVSLDATRIWYRGDLNEITARVSGCTPDFSRPTGVIDFLDGGIDSGSAPVANQTATLTLPSPPVGTHHYYASYGGDANFFAVRSTYGITVNVYAPVPIMTLESEPGTSNLRIVLNGRAGHTPTGSIAVTEGTAATPRSVDGPLQPYGVDSSFATASGFSSATRSITISYPGDAYFDPATQTFPIILHGDPNGDAIIDAADVFYLVNYLYGGGPPPIRDGDCNADGVVTAVDLFYLINYVFAGGAAPL